MKFITKAYIQAALPDIRALLVKAEETSVDVRNVVLNAPEQALSVQLCYMLALLTKNRALDKVQAESWERDIRSFEKQTSFAISDFVKAGILINGL